MREIVFKATWVEKTGWYTIKAQFFGQSSPAFWELSPGCFLDLVEKAETTLEKAQNPNEHQLEFVDKLGNEVRISLAKLDKEGFRKIVVYLRQVWKDNGPV